ncbi:restriction endonuclease subunit S [Enterococcus durans]|uniref:restriction endonuclease subunit S n=1 Tax=Enterococcus durans TaxID=53345 RepID=UPI000F4F5A23|nr:restriction endonuclease subunit S [Enterococcus durans]
MSNDIRPEIRFPGFTEAWEQRKVGEFYDFKNGLNKEKEFFGSGVPIVNFVDVFHNRGLTPEMLKGRVTLSEKEIKNFEVKQGDIFFTRTSETINEIGYPSVMLGAPTDTVFSGFVLRGRARNVDPMNNLFKRYVFFTESFRNEMVKKSSMTTRALTSGTAIKEMYVQYPTSKDEQHKIGAFLAQIDETITLKQRKLDLLKETKKGFLQKMFPKNGAKVPEIRFPGFTEDWEERKLGEISPLRGGFAFKSNKFVKEGIPIVRISNILSNGSVGGEFVYYTVQEKDENYLLPDKSALLAMSGATTGKVSILNNPNNNKVYQNQRVGYFTKTKNVDYSFISTLVRSKIFLDQLNSVLVAGAQPNISSKDINVFELTIPKNIEEQKKIGNFFKQLDDTIALHQRKLDLLKETKKGFLQKMFV